GGAGRGRGLPWLGGVRSSFYVVPVAGAPAVPAAERGAEWLLVQRDPGSLEPGARAGAAPSPVQWVAHEGRFDRVAGDVAADAKQVQVAVDLAREEVSSEEVGAPASRLVVQPRVPGVQALQRGREAGSWAGDHQVVVRAHERPRDEPDLEGREDGGQAVDE